ncbi:MAG: TetR/AcrR family transcriptional regulator [Cyclobacteriaceae bacterium]|jgi:AcrR family transcriptional regulator|nr:TetR/AcrR family transcriptional regulator [Cyclobacteriaceae bacterium]
MPTETFLNLSEEKRQRFIEAALKEFADHNYDTASVNRIIKELGIARGSVYQYFTDKLDLWLYLKEYSEQQKMNVIQSVDRKAFTNFWDYYRALFTQGIHFDLQHPLCSRFLYRIGYKESSKEVSNYLDGWKSKAKLMFTHWVEEEKEAGTINPSIPTELAVHFLISMSTSITELLQNKYEVNFDENFKNGKPLIASNITEFQLAVNELIQLLAKALT